MPVCAFIRPCNWNLGGGCPLVGPAAIHVGLSALAFTAGPALAQPSPAPGTVQPRHVTHPAPAHKMPKMTAKSADMSADDLNAKELASR